MVPSYLKFVLLMVLVLFPIMYVSSFSYVCIPELPPNIWNGHLTQSIICFICLLTSLHVVTSFTWYIVGGAWDLIVSLSGRCPL